MPPRASNRKKLERSSTHGGGSFELPDTTLEELWEILARGDFSLEVADFIDCYKQCERKGLGSDIAEVIPQEVASDGFKELQYINLSQLAHLIYSLIDGAGDRETIVNMVRSLEFKMMDYKDMMQGRPDSVLRLKQFRALIPCLSQLLQIDECFIISWFIWHLKGRFEMPQPLYSAFIQRLQAHRTRQSRMDSDEAGIDITCNDFTRLFHEGHLRDTGFHYEEAESFFDRTLHHLGSLLARAKAARDGRHADEEALEASVRSKGFVGRTQVSVLIYELYSALPSNPYPSPHDLVVALLQVKDLVEQDAEMNAKRFAKAKSSQQLGGTVATQRKSFPKRSQTAPAAMTSRRLISIELEEFDGFVTELRDRFKVLDVNGDGFLDYDELSELLRDTIGAVDDEQIRDVFSKLDGSGDGLIAFNEFVNYIKPDTSEACAVKEQYDKLDTNKDGLLEFGELVHLLQKGNPHIKEHEVRMLFDEADVDDNGVVDFSEFVGFLFNNDARSKSSVKKTRQAASVAKKARAEAEQKLADVKPAFVKYGGRDHKISGVEFSRMCKEAGLYDAGFCSGDVDVIFGKVAKKGERAIGIKQFKAGLKHIADKKGCSAAEVHDKIATYVTLFPQ